MTKKDFDYLTLLKTRQLTNFCDWSNKSQPVEKQNQLRPARTSLKEMAARLGVNWERKLRYFADTGLITLGEPSGGYITVSVHAPIQPDLSLLPKKKLPNDPTTRHMAESLRSASLPRHLEGIPDYYHAFDAARHGSMAHWLKKDSFSGRMHSWVTNIPTAMRRHILLGGRPTVELDLGQCQVHLLAMEMARKLGANGLSALMEGGGDLYEMLAAKAGLFGRPAGKQLFFKLAFGQPDSRLEDMFGGEPWVRYLNELKRHPLPIDPRYRPTPKYMAAGSVSHHNNAAFLLQKYEVYLFKRYVWRPLCMDGVPFLTVHDSVIVAVEHEGVALEQMQRLPILGARIRVTHPT